MSSPEHRELTNWILDQIRRVNPYPRQPDDQRGYIYAYGFLASYLATILAQDPILRRQFRQRIEQLEKRKKR